MTRMCGILAALALLSACAGHERTQPALADRGRALAEAHCASCHAIGPTGESPAPEAPPFRLMARNFRVATLETALNQGISAGHPAMPDMRFPPQDVRALIVYLDAVQDRPH